jgi:hypothetical protein
MKPVDLTGILSTNTERVPSQDILKQGIIFYMRIITLLLSTGSIIHKITCFYRLLQLLLRLGHKTGTLAAQNLSNTLFCMVLLIVL